MMLKKIKRFGSFFLYLSLSFPLFYFVYKYGDPEPLAHDFFQYYHLYQRMDVFAVISPHNMRLLGAFFVFLLYKLNVFFDTPAAFDKYLAWGFMKQVYFCAVLFNYLCVAATCVVIYKILKRELTDRTMGFIGGLMYLLGFGTIFYCIMPLTEAFSILLFSVFLFYYRKRSNWAMLYLCALIFQREYLLIVILTLAFTEYAWERNKYHFRIGMLATLSFAVYYVLRKTVFFNPALDFQSNPAFMLKTLLGMDLDKTQYLRQMLLGMNLLGVYTVLLFYKSRKKMVYDQRSLLLLLFLFLEVNVISLAGGHGNNVGRYFYLVVPLLIIVLVKELAVFILPEQVAKNLVVSEPATAVLHPDQQRNIQQQVQPSAGTDTNGND